MSIQARPAIGDVMRGARPRQSPYVVMFWRLVVGLLILGFWQWASGTLIRETFLAKPTSILRELYVLLIVKGTIWIHVWVTLQEVLIGFLIGGSLGLVMGFVLGNSRFLSAVLEPYIMGFYGIPRIALAPIIIILLGIGIWSKVVIVVIQVFFMLFINAYAGVKNINQEYVQLARIMGASESLIIRRIIVPSTIPFIMLGLRSAMPYAVIGAIVGEFIAASKGLGYFINYAGSMFDSKSAFAGIFILLAFIMSANALMQRLERAAVKWKRVEAQAVEG